MQIDVRVDKSILGSEGLHEHAEAVVEDALNRFRDRISVVEVHLSDLNGNKGGPDDKSCMMEARLDGRNPKAVVDHASTFEQAIKAAAGKLKRVIESDLGRESSLHEHRDHR